MKLTTKQDLEAPIQFVWLALTDFPAWERTAMRHGVEVVRTATPEGNGAGLAWSAKFVHKGQQRQLSIRLADVDPPVRMKGLIASKMFAGEVVVELMELSPKRTRVIVSTEVAPQTLAARLVLQSLKLAKGRMQRRYDKRIALYCEEVERRFAKERR